MIENFIIYNSIGRILRTGRAPSEMVAIQAVCADEFVMVGEASDATQYILNGAVTDKPDMPVIIDKTAMLADGVDVATISGIPVGCTCEVNGQTGVVDDGTLELTFDHPGQYTLTLTVFPNLDYSVVINAT